MSKYDRIIEKFKQLDPKAISTPEIHTTREGAYPYSIILNFGGVGAYAKHGGVTLIGGLDLETAEEITDELKIVKGFAEVDIMLEELDAVLNRAEETLHGRTEFELSDLTHVSYHGGDIEITQGTQAGRMNTIYLSIEQLERLYKKVKGE